MNYSHGGEGAAVTAEGKPDNVRPGALDVFYAPSAL
jgi:hypothetical protein